jgi:hypothetical protein
MYANHPEMAKRWEKHTPKGKKLPEHVSKEKHEKKAMFIRAFVQSFYDKLGLTKDAAASRPGILLTLTKLAQVNLQALVKTATAGSQLPPTPPPGGGRGSPSIPPAQPAVLPMTPGVNYTPGQHGPSVTISEELANKILQEKGGPLSNLALAIGAPFVVGGLGGAGLARLMSPSHEDIGNLQKQELITQYDNAIEEMKRRIATRR